jgi:cysteine-rich repeat protein
MRRRHRRRRRSLRRRQLRWLRDRSLGLGPHFGDGERNGDEACDDGDEVNGNGCFRASSTSTTRVRSVS